MRILIAEDDRTSRKLLSAVLEKQGHTVVVTEDGQQAWDVLRKEGAPRLAVLDWMMPNLDGLEVLQRTRLREKEQTVRPTYVIMLTALGESRFIAQGLEAGADDYITKPFNPIELQARLTVGHRLIARDDALRDAMSQIRTLRGVIPICMNCKKVRQDKGFWRRVEDYVTAHTEALFSHGLCPECAEKLYPDEMGDD